MLTFEVREMAECDSAVAIVKAVMVLDNDAVVRIDMAHHSVEVEPALAGVEELRHAIMDAGFSPVLVPSEHRPWPEGIIAAVPGAPPRLPPKIPFDGLDHDFRPGSAERDEYFARDNPRNW